MTTITLSEEQLEEVRRGEPIAVRSSELREPLFVCSQSELAELLVAAVRTLRENGRADLADDELREEVQDLLERRAWALLGRRTAIRQIREEAEES